MPDFNLELFTTQYWIYPDFTAASFFDFIFRALKPCDQDSPISVCNGNQSTTQHVPSTNDHEWHAKEGDSTPDSFVYWKGKHTFLERKAIKNT